MSHPSTWASVAIGSLPDAGMVTFVDASGVTVTTPMSDFKKRLLLTTDISWMTDGLSNVDSLANGDFVFVWDATAGKVVTLTRNALLNHLLGTEDVSWMSALNFSDIVGTTDKFVMVDASSSGKKLVLLSADELLTKLLSHKNNHYTSATNSISAALTGQRLTNRGAVITVECDLPAGADGLRYSATRIANYPFRLDPNGSEAIGYGGNGKYLELTSRGQVDIVWIEDRWEVCGGSAVYEFEE